MNDYKVKVKDLSLWYGTKPCPEKYFNGYSRKKGNCIYRAFGMRKVNLSQDTEPDE